MFACRCCQHCALFTNKPQSSINQSTIIVTICNHFEYALGGNMPYYPQQGFPNQRPPMHQNMQFGFPQHQQTQVHNVIVTGAGCTKTG